MKKRATAGTARWRSIGVAFTVFAIAAASCTSGSDDDATTIAPSTSAPPITGGSTTTTAPTAAPTPSTTQVSPAAAYVDPRRRIPNLSDPSDLRGALIAMAITPVDADPALGYLEAQSPVAWAPGSAPGFFTDIYALEVGGLAANGPGTIQGYTVAWEPALGEDGPVSLFSVSVSYAADAESVAEFLFAELEGSDSFPPGTQRIERPDGSRYVWGDFGSTLLVHVKTVQDFVITTWVVGDEPDLVEETGDAAVDAAVAQVERVLTGDYGYGPFAPATQASSAEWSFFEGDPDGMNITFDGRFDDASGSACTLTVGQELVAFELAFDPDGIGTVFAGGRSFPSDRGAWPLFGDCGRTYPGQPALFSPVQPRSVQAFMRNVPDLGSFPAEAEAVAGFPTIRYDVSAAYDEFLRRFTGGIEVERFDLWLHADNGWLVGWKVELGGDAADLERNGFGGGGATAVVSEFQVTVVDGVVGPIVLTDSTLTPNPDDAVVVFTSERIGNTRDIYVRDSAGTVRALTTHPNADELPMISPDGGTIAFTSRRTGNDSIFLVDVDGGNLRRLTVPISDGGDSWATWSPDGAFIAFGSNRDCCDDDLWVIGADGSDVHKVFGSPDGDEAWPAWSPRGDLIAFVSDMDDGVADVYTIRPDGTDLRRLTSGGADDYLRPAWSPDGRRLLVTALEAGQPVMYLMDPDGSERSVVDTGGIAGGFGVFSPSGEHVVFTDAADLWSIRLDGSELQQLTIHSTIDTVPSVGIPAEGG